MSGRYLSVALVLAVPLTVLADTPKRGPAAKLASDNATVLSRKPTDVMWDWTPVAKNAELMSGDQLIGLPDANIDSLNGAVRLTMRTDLANRSLFPIIESSVRLEQPTKDVDLDFWLDRGRVDLVNQKKSGAARVNVRFLTRVWDLVLEKPGTRVAMEIYGRWPQGTIFNPTPGPKDAPVTSVVLVVLEGEVQRSCSLCSVALHAPPGPAEFAWDSLHGDDRGGQKLDKLPDWVKTTDPKSPEMQKRLLQREAFRKTIEARGLGEAIYNLLQSKDPEARRVGVYTLAAFDQMPSLGALLRGSDDLEMWNHVVVALRHWLGRGAGQEVKLHKLLVSMREYPNKQADQVIQLLFGFPEEYVTHPVLYAQLINMLKSDKLAIRGLAYWHLQRLAPNVKVSFHPRGEEAERERAWKEYKAAIPDGKLPPEKN